MDKTFFQRKYYFFEKCRKFEFWAWVLVFSLSFEFFSPWVFFRTAKKKPGVYGTLPKPLGLWASTKVGFTSIDAVLGLESAFEVLKSFWSFGGSFWHGSARFDGKCASFSFREFFQFHFCNIFFMRYNFDYNLKRFRVISGPWKIPRVGG